MAIRALIGGREIPREQVLGWEARRIDAAARKLGVRVPPGDLAQRRAALLQMKLELGAAAIAACLSRDVRWAERIGRASARPRGRRRSVCDLHVDSGSAAGFAAWFRQRTAAGDEAAMLAACPDHFVLRTGADGRQEVLETTGGSPLASRFFVEYGDVAALVTPADPAFPEQLAGVARLPDGAAVGGVRHQFRDEGGGFHARLTVEFPVLTNPYMVARHRWHLACEFSNWIEAALAAEPAAPVR